MAYVEKTSSVVPKIDSSDCCEHNYAIAHKETLAFNSYHGYEETKIIIFFYCTKCLELEKEVLSL